ncbi:MAG: prepilin-type N-terminal cleavage/methylation domain-containing protein, partial [Planctomycetes bacterium]|nr:prepilin-type N-terminal cleavage/methylation domain-containing protein [Planctomycetota bacterium]
MRGTKARRHEGTKGSTAFQAVTADRTAFSLAELMIALAVLGIGLLFIAAALPVGISYTRESVDIASSEAAAQEAMQTLENNLRLSRQLSPIARIVDHPPRTPSEVAPPLPLNLPSGLSLRADSFFRPRHTPPNAVFPVWRYPSNLEPREGNHDHPYNDPFGPSTAPAPLNWDRNWHPDSRTFGYEPFIKVRPLTMTNLGAYKQGGWRPRVVDDGEYQIETYQTEIGLSPQAAGDVRRLLEFDDENALDMPTNPSTNLSLLRNPLLSPLDRFYPPVTPVMPFRAEQFVAPQPNDVYQRYDERRFTSQNPAPPNNYVTGYLATELDKTQDRRVAWTAFYRRVSYDQVEPGPNGTFDGPNRPAAVPPVWPMSAIGDDVVRPADPELYEVIVVVVRRPSAQHRFAAQDMSRTGLQCFDDPRALAERPSTNNQNDPAYIRGGDRLAPTPWLALFDTAEGSGSADYFMQGLRRGTATTNDFNDQAGPNVIAEGGLQRPLRNGYPERTSLRFRVRPGVARLLAAGSDLI